MLPLTSPAATGERAGGTGGRMCPAAASASRRRRAVSGAIGERAAGHFLRQLIAGLRYLERHKVMHRDLKPANLLLDRPSFV